MDHKQLIELLQDVREGRVTVEAAVQRLRALPYEDLDFARIDHHRALRQGLPEVVFCQGKTPAQVAEIIAHLAEHNDRVLATRADPSHYAATLERVADAHYHEQARAIVVDRRADRTGEAWSAGDHRRYR